MLVDQEENPDQSRSFEEILLKKLETEDSKLSKSSAATQIILKED